MKIPRLVLGLVTVATLSVMSTRSEAQIKYVDRQGITHWVQSDNQIPPEYRAESTQPELPRIGPGDERQRRRYQQGLDAEMRVYDRINAIKDRKAAAEDRARRMLDDALDRQERRRAERGD